MVKNALNVLPMARIGSYTYQPISLKQDRLVAKEPILCCKQDLKCRLSCKLIVSKDLNCISMERKHDKRPCFSGKKMISNLSNDSE